MDVLLVAAKKEKIADYTSVISQAGRVPVIVDVDAFALQNAYEINYGPSPGAIVVLLNAGASAININILSGDQSLFTRDISIGGNAYTEAVQKELSLPFDRAEQAKKGQPTEGAFDDVRPVLHAMTENVLLENPEDLRLLQGDGGVRPHRSDPAERRRVAVDGFAEALAERFNAPVEMFDPFRKIAFDAAEARRGAAGDRTCRRWPSVSRFEGRATDDQDQPLAVERKAAKKKAAVVVVAVGAEGSRSAALILLVRRPRHRLAVLVTRAAVRPARHRHRHRPQPKPRACRSASSRSQKFEQRKAQLQQRVALIDQLRKGPERPGAHARSDQPVAAADAVAHQHEAGRLRRSPSTAAPR